MQKISSHALLNNWKTGKGIALTFMGMSGVGKTTLAQILHSKSWFHYSGDYRIGTRYLNDAMVDDVKHEAMKNRILCDHLRRDLIHVGINITVDNLSAMSEFLGRIKVGSIPGKSPQNLNSRDIDEFKRRLDLYRKAEINAMLDVGEFLDRARTVYRYDNFINDAGGSLCEIVDIDDDKIKIDPVLQHIGTRSLIVYLASSEDNRHRLIQTATSDPKPIYYRPEFLDKHLTPYLNGDEPIENRLPHDFQAQIFSDLIDDRQMRYQKIADEWGVTIASTDISPIIQAWLNPLPDASRPDLAAELEESFVNLLAKALEQTVQANSGQNYAHQNS